MHLPGYGLQKASWILPSQAGSTDGRKLYALNPLSGEAPDNARIIPNKSDIQDYQRLLAKIKKTKK